MAKYQKYEEYKDSEVGLLGRIPFGWKVLRYKNILKIMQGMAFKSSEYVDNSNVVNIRMGNIKKGGHIDLKHNTKYLPEKYKDIYSEYKLCEGDAIIAMTDMSPSLEFLAVPAILEGLDLNTIYLLNQRVGKLILDKEFDIRFIRYWLLSDELRGQLKAKGLGTVQANMSNDDLYGSYFFCPSSNERVKIVNFLDYETAQIDTLIEKQQTLIQLLKEKRQAVISHAVTKGLNPDAPMKDSGVEWLGEVPEHWELPKLIHQTSKIGDGLHSTPQYQDGTGYYFVNGNNLVSGQIVVSTTSKEVPEDEYKKHYIYLDNSSVLLSINGTIGNVARYNNEMVILGKSAAYMNCADSLLPEYLMVLLQSSQAHYYFDLEVTGTTIYNLSLNSIRQMRVCIPPKQEQSKIHKFCELQQNKYDTLIEKASTAIRLMQERRTALISAAVTGKIDVRGWQAPITDN